MQAKTQAEFDRYITSDEGSEYLASREFEERWLELARHLDVVGEMTLADVAEFVGLPVNVLRHLYALNAVSEALATAGAPAGTTMH